jgi:hypothetical protein
LRHIPWPSADSSCFDKTLELSLLLYASANRSQLHVTASSRVLRRGGLAARVLILQRCVSHLLLALYVRGVMIDPVGFCDHGESGPNA